MTKQVDEFDLKFLTAYWCKPVSGKYEDRFDWAIDKADEAVWEIEDRARRVLTVLAKTAPDNLSAAYFAAGPLENYINLVVQEKDANEAAFITGHPFLRPLLHYVWGDIEQLKPLAKQQGNSTIKFEEPRPEKELKAIDIKDLMSFWCHTCVTSLVTKYEKQYNKVLKQLLNKNSREAVMHDLRISAPDDRAITYLEENIFVLQNWQD